jgi:general stress protein 13
MNNAVQHKIGDKVIVTISAIKPFGAFGDLEDGGSGLIHISEITDGYVSDIAQFLPLGTTHEVLIIGLGDKPFTYSLSLRRLNRRRRQFIAKSKKPLGRREYNKEEIDKISFVKTSQSIDGMIQREYQRLKGGN